MAEKIDPSIDWKEGVAEALPLADASFHAVDALRAPFVLGNAEALGNVFEEAGVDHVRVDTRVGTARFPSIRTLVEADLRGWLPVMGVHLSEEKIQEILQAAEDRMSDLVTDEGVVFDSPAHIVSGTA